MIVALATWLVEELGNEGSHDSGGVRSVCSSGNGPVRQHNGQLAWWWCTNSPLYRKYLAMRLAEVAKAQPDGLHIDDYRGSSGAVTWRSACFCRHCMAAFRAYLAKAVSKEKLAALGISDLNRFDYRQFLLDQGVKPEDYQNRRTSLPLVAEFRDFQVKADTTFVADYRHRAQQMVGHPLSLCVNSGLDDGVTAAGNDGTCQHCQANGRALHRTDEPALSAKCGSGITADAGSSGCGAGWTASQCYHERRLTAVPPRPVRRRLCRRQ